MKTSPVYEMPSDKYNEQLASALREIPEFKEPEWVAFVKTGVAKKRPPQEKDFWYKRSASILRQIYIHKTVGTNRLRTRYGSKKNRGMKPERFKKASGKIIRVILQQAEAAGLLEKYNESGKRAGRRLTEKGRELLDNIKIGKGELINISENKQLPNTENEYQDNDNVNNNNEILDEKVKEENE